jgi:hypothetical protein
VNVTLRRPSKGEEVTNISIAWGAGPGLSDGDFENGDDVSDPPLQTLVRECQSILQGDWLVNSSAVMEEEKVVGAVNVSDLRKKECPSIGDGAIDGIMKMAIPKGPLAPGDWLELMAKEVNKVARLVPVSGEAQSAQVGMLEIKPGVMKETVEQGVSP